MLGDAQVLAIEKHGKFPQFLNMYESKEEKNKLIFMDLGRGYIKHLHKVGFM